MIVNPFTGQVVNANPEGHNQFWNPDGTVRPTASGKMTRFRKLIDHLNKSSLDAGRKLYGAPTYETGDYSGLAKDPSLSMIIRMGLQDRENEAFNNHGDEDSIDDYEYVFKPSSKKGKGFDSSGTSTTEALRRWKDKDGRLYTYSSTDGAVYVIDPKKRGVKGYDFLEGKKIRRPPIQRKD